MFHTAVMDVIKMQCETDPLPLERKINTDIEEQKLQEGNVSYLQVTGIKTECIDHSSDVKSEMTFDKTHVPIDLSFVKNEVEEENVLKLHMSEIKTECMDHSYDLKAEMTFEESPVPVDFSIMKNEVEDEACDIIKEDKEAELQETAEENEVFTEGHDGRNQDGT
ncbi:gelsolin-related protein of 125 kDa-like isoform X8 [Periplaneta americana]|uniref:gelsolin-related protein of 125 kDa-like isoform X8 n=1 Tax=Periplaneta americana TaxID=6978 RepID=UPI0037E77674